MLGARGPTRFTSVFLLKSIALGAGKRAVGVFGRQLTKESAEEFFRLAAREALAPDAEALLKRTRSADHVIDVPVVFGFGSFPPRGYFDERSGCSFRTGGLAR